jgi:ribosomal protein L3 glutamine methyltransferase
LCTGSGCIGIACAVAFPKASVVLSDISRDALTVAEINCKRHHLGNRAELIESDLFTNLPEKKYDLIVTNPPYVDAQDLETMPDEYRQEPAQGLASGTHGLDCIRAILKAAPEYLNDYGVLVAEVGNSQAALEQEYPNVPFLWLDFEHGGNGVFVLTAGQLQQYKNQF